MNFFKRLQGVFFEPKATLEGVAEKPVWADMLILFLVLVTVYAVLIGPTMRREQLQMMKDSPKLEERLGKERYEAQIKALEGPATPAQMLQTVIGTPVFLGVALLIQAALLLIFGRFMSSQGTFKQAFAALTHASIINALLGNAVRVILVFMRKSVMQTSTSLALLFPKMEVTSTTYMVLTQVDLFQLWLFGVLGYGLAAIFKVDTRKALTLSYSVWFLKALVNIGLGLLGRSFMQ